MPRNKKSLMQINILTAAEESLMKLLWKLNSFYLKDVMEQHAEPKPHQNTVSTYLKILIEKDYLETQKEGRIFKYSVKVAHDDYKKFIINNFIENHFDNDKKLFLKFLSDSKISETKVDKPIARISKIELPTEDESPKEKTKVDENPIADFIEELTNPKKFKKEKTSKDKPNKDKKKDKEKDKKKKKK